MPKARKSCPKHTTGTGPCYCQYRKDSDNTYYAPDDVKEVVADISTIIGQHFSNKMSPLKEKRVRYINSDFIFSRLYTLSGANLTRAYKTVANLRE